MRANRTRKAKLSSSILSHLLSFSLAVLSLYLSSAESHVVWPFPPGVPVILTAVPAAIAVADGGMSAYLSDNMWVAVQLCREVDLVWCWDYWETFTSLSFLPPNHVSRAATCPVSNNVNYRPTVLSSAWPLICPKQLSSLLDVTFSIRHNILVPCNLLFQRNPPLPLFHLYTL